MVGGLLNQAQNVKYPARQLPQTQIGTLFEREILKYLTEVEVGVLCAIQGVLKEM